jgi:thymidylate synthase
MVSAWNVGKLHEMVLPPCHYGFQVYTRELSLSERTEYKKKRDGISRTFAQYTHQMLDNSNIPTRAISLMWNQRSVDTFLGLPFNIASYGLLLEMIAREVNMVPEHLIGHLGDTHLYSNHIEQAVEQLSRTPKELPTLKMSSGHNFRAALAGKADEIDLNDFILLGYEPHPTIKAPLSN